MIGEMPLTVDEILTVVSGLISLPNVFDLLSAQICI